MRTPQYILPLDDELIVDLFAGGGGASTGIEAALGRHVDIAVNHDPMAVAMHRVNHPQAQHFLADVWEVDPVTVCAGRPVGHLHASPDCTHFSQAKGGQPRDRAIRSLSWVVHRWAGKVRPRVITLENVEQILQWSPLVAKRDPATGRVVRVDGTVAEPGERVPVHQQQLVPDQRHRGRNWRHFVDGLRRMGYDVQWRKIIAADHGAPTTRERLYMVARCDGEAIEWPEPTHAKKRTRGSARKPWRPVADIIDWSIPCPSIFDRKRPLADATMRRVARGTWRYVLTAAEPFIVPVKSWSGGGNDSASIDDPLRTVTTSKRGEFAVCAPIIAPITHQGADRGRSATEPLATVTTANRGEHALIGATLIQAGYGEREGQEPRVPHLDKPLGTIVAGGRKHALVSAFLAQMNGGFYDERGGAGRGADVPLSTITNRGTQQQLVTVHLAPEHEAGALRVAAFLMHYYGSGGQHGDLRDPAATITTRDRLALVTVTISGTRYVIVDIGMRMLVPRELYLAQGFPIAYVIDRGIDEQGREITLTKTAQVRMVGNSVSPLPMHAIVAANHRRRAAAMRRAA
ncbi:DNA cytosine methyltransferase [Rubrivivax sp. JA1026]|uniref:DNA cytosine methyltransferase n=1 Tax=Rubrivivax sp. JA1026 TaxID=2710888 RepID=UPI0013E97DD1|nr:DNA cytosine methyltransferase [Rubrivivax sp. JA1026]